MSIAKPTPLCALAAAAMAVASAAPAQTAIGDLSGDRLIEIRGTVTDVFGNRFVVEDATGTTLVETGPAWHHDLAVRVGEDVAVRGEPEDGGFDAFSIVRADGTVTEIRPEQGPPPWAGGRD